MSKLFLGRIFFLSKRVHVMFLHVLEALLVCFSRSAYRERRRREHGSITNGPFSSGSIFTISTRFRLFWALEAVRAKTKETIVGIKVVYDIYKHSRSVAYSK